jgi:hypothetical protein
MPKLPRSSLADVSPVQNRRVVNQENRASGNDPMGAQLTATGNAAFEASSRIREAHITAEVASAQNDLRLRLDSEYRALQADNGPAEELEAKFAARAKEVVGETSKGMSSPMHKRLFEAQSAELATAYTVKTRDLTRQKQLEGARALVMNTVDGVATTAADPDNPRAVLEENAATARDNVRRQQSMGVLTADQAAEAEIRIDTALKSGISIRNVKTIEDYIDAGDAVSIAKAQLLLADDKDNKFRSEILPEKRQALEEVLQVKAEQSTAYAQADAAYTNANQNEAAALADLRATITDIETLKTSEARVRQLASDDRAAETDRANDATNAGWDIIVRGGSLSSIPASVLAEIPGATKKIMQNEVEARADRARRYQEADDATRREIRENSTTAYNELLAVAESDGELFAAGPMAWMARDPLMAATYKNLTPVDVSKIEKEVEKRKAGGGTTDAAGAVFKDLVDQVPFMAPTVMSSSILPWVSPKPVPFDEKSLDQLAKTPGIRGDKTDMEFRLQGILRRVASEEAERNPGAKLTQQRARELTSLAFAELGQKKDGSTKYPISQDLAADIAGRNIRSASISAAREDPRVYAEARRIALMANPAATEADVLMRYDQIQSRMAQAKKPPVFAPGDR